MARTAHAFRNSHSRRARIGGILAAFGMLATSGGFALNQATEQPHSSVQAGALGDAGMTVGMAATTGGCIYAPTPWTCGAAVGSTMAWIDGPGQQPLHGNPDMTQDGPLPAL